MTSKDYTNMLRFITRFSDECDWMSEEGLAELKSTIEAERNIEDVKDFYKYLTDTMPDVNDNNAWDKFCRTPFYISFGGRSVRIENEAAIYDGIRTALSDLLEQPYGNLHMIRRLLNVTT